MAVLSRQKVVLAIALLLVALLPTVTYASTATYLSRINTTPTLSRRTPPIVTDNHGNFTVTDPVTKQRIAQSPASDGSGVDFSPPAIIWLVFSFAVGAPLAFTGVRLSRVTTGAGVGLSLALLLWTAFVNNLPGSGVSDLALTLMVLGGFLCGFGLGAFQVGHLAGITTLGILGGISVGVRIVLFRSDLLVPIFYVNWIIIAVCGILGFIPVLIKQRISLLISSSSTGTFLLALGVDLILKRQAGMSTGLRYLFDRNPSHLADLYTRGWQPSITTDIIIAVSLALIPALALLQRTLFRQAFMHLGLSSSDSLLEDAEKDSAPRASSTTAPKKPLRFSIKPKS